MDFVSEKFAFPENIKKYLNSIPYKFGYGELSNVVFYKNYSAIKPDGNKETWQETCIRVIEGILSILKTNLNKNKFSENGLISEFNEGYWIDKGISMCVKMIQLKWTPAGRGLFQCGREEMHRTGFLSMNNCAFVSTQGDLGRNIEIIMELLMLGIGVGSDTRWRGKLYNHNSYTFYTYFIPDTRNGWAESTRLLIEFYTKLKVSKPIFDYSKIRPQGLPLKTFGGVSSGPAPLITLHENIEQDFKDYFKKKINLTVLLANIVNRIGKCVVIGNIRRSAEILLGSVNDKTFINLKNYKVFPNRQDIAYTSNNSVVFQNSEDYLKIPEIARRINDNAEPGFINLKNIQKYGRYGEIKPDKAIGTNPCGEIPLEHCELCNLTVSYPYNCESIKEWYEVLGYCTLYSTILSSMQCHIPEINEVINRNHRIGVCISGIVEWMEKYNFSDIINFLRIGYRVVENENIKISKMLKQTPAIRLTSIKPDGTLSLLTGLTGGIDNPIGKYILRRIRIGKKSHMAKFLIKNNIPYESDAVNAENYCFEFPIENKTSITSNDITIWEKLQLVATFAREWADNSISFTATYNKETEGNQIESLISMFMPVIKGLTLFPENITNNINISDEIRIKFPQTSKELSEKYPDLLYTIKALSLEMSEVSIEKIKEDIYNNTDKKDNLYWEIIELIRNKISSYRQLPNEHINEKHFKELKMEIPKINWLKYKSTDITNDINYCTSDKCIL